MPLFRSNTCLLWLQLFFDFPTDANSECAGRIQPFAHHQNFNDADPNTYQITLVHIVKCSPSSVNAWKTVSDSIETSVAPKKKNVQSTHSSKNVASDQQPVSASGDIWRVSSNQTEPGQPDPRLDVAR
jgi:hypothetical protein